MKYLKLAFGLVFVTGLMAVSASSAMALEPRWVTCAKVTGGFTEADCATAGAGSWSTKGFAANETIEATSSGTLTLEDRKPKLGGAVTIECSGTDQGWIGGINRGEENRVTASHCAFVGSAHGACEPSAEPRAEAVNLPWSTVLEERENKEGKIEVRNLLTSLVAGKNPGWAVKCTVGGIIKITDTCTGRTSTAVEPARNRLLTNFVFDKVSEEEAANCTESEEEKTGFVKGTVSGSIRNKNGELQALWVLASVLKT